MHQPHRVTVVLVEDDPGHALLIEKSLRRAGIVNPIVTLVDGGAAVEYLFGQGKEAGNSLNRPLLVLLDLNLPVLDGYQVLERLKSDKRTRHIPVVILTSTDTPEEIARCYKLGCNVYVIKPVEEGRFSDAIWKLGMFLSIVKVPEAVENDG
jgi:CheY-like chemotaxis protein